MILQNLIDDAETTLQTKIGDRRSRAWPAPTFGSAGTFPFIYFNPFLPSLFFYRPFAALTWGRGARWEPPLDRGRWSPVRHAVPPPQTSVCPSVCAKTPLPRRCFCSPYAPSAPCENQSFPNRMQKLGVEEACISAAIILNRYVFQHSMFFRKHYKYKGLTCKTTNAF